MRRIIVGVALCLVAACTPLQGQPLVPNASFENGTDSPQQWRLSGGRGTWGSGGAADGDRCVSVTGNGADNNQWLSEPLALQPGSLYVVTFAVKSDGAIGGTAVSGPLFCNRDLGSVSTEWTRYASVFATPAALARDRARLRFGQWHAAGRVSFDDVAVYPVQAVHTTRDGMTLGQGETLKGNAYTFDAPFRSGFGNVSRPLSVNRCDFNSDRWTFGAGSEVIYRHELRDRRLTEATVNAAVTWYRSGQLALSVSTNGTTWHALARQGALGAVTPRVPRELLPADVLWVRLRAEPTAADARSASFQVGNYGLEAVVTGEPLTLTGTTRFVRMVKQPQGVAVTIEDVGDGLPGGRNELVLRVAHKGPRPVTVTPEVVLEDGTGARRVSQLKAVTLRPGETPMRLPYEVPGTGEWTVTFALGDRFRAATVFSVPGFYDTTYGERLPGSSEALALWWASSGWKIPRTRSAPAAEGAAIRIAAARGESEAAQFVLRPSSRQSGVTVGVSPLSGPHGAAIPGDRVDVLRVAYVPVTRPTDRTGIVAPWPDPLPPLRTPIDLAPGVNQPLWIRVNVPHAVPAGNYTGTITVRRAGGALASVPLQVRVYGFELPDTMTCQTAFGVRTSLIYRYHGVSDAAQRRRLLEMYWENYSRHHISPYNPAPLDPFHVTWPDLGAWEGGRRDLRVKHGGQSALALADTNAHRSVSAGYGKKIRIPGAGVRLSFWYKTGEPGHESIVTFNHHDADGTWLSGRNNDMRFRGDGTWQRFDRTVKGFPKQARFLRLTLWPTLYREDGATTGTVWFDDLSLTDAASGEALVTGGEFEPASIAQFRPVFDWARWDAAMERAIGHYHFNSFRMPVQGLGGGTFHARYEPRLLGYGESTPEYQAAFSAYIGGLQRHLEAKGWLDEAFVYWFDEPDPKDYAFVNNGFRKLKSHAPRLRRMLTEQVEDALVGGPTIWCPVSHHYNHDRAEERRRQGEDFWWYVCTGPKAPYCTLFIDHPATEMRAWLWQTWQRGITGILVWESTYWTSATAYPDPALPQNPYEDPMGWVSGYDTPQGTRRAWGNGDGRFVYPPEAAADGKPGRPIMEGPVDSIRWEMLRDGIEDYEYMVMLRALLKAQGTRLAPGRRAQLETLLVVPESITSDMTHFTTDPAPIEAHRHAVAEAIETLSRP